MATELGESAFTQLEQMQAEDAVKQLEQIDVLRLSKDETDRLESMLTSLPQEVLRASPELCYRMVLAQNQKGDLQAAYKWYNTLTGLRDSIRDSAPGRPLLENRIFCAGLCLPQGPNTNLLLSFAVLANEFGAAKFPLARLSATGKFPSVLRGAKDLSNLGKHFRASASIVRPLLHAFLEDDGNGVCEAAIAEILYEQNDLNGASLQAAGAINADNPEITFAALSLLARLGAVDTAAKPPAEILSHIGDMLEKKEAHWLIPNYKALCARFDILRGDTDNIRHWMEQCGLNDLNNCAIRDSYALITKAKAYIALGEYRNAATLLESLTLTMQKENRVLDTVECLANGAIVCELLGSGELAAAKLEQALLLAQEYGYVRVFADCGKQLFHLIIRYAKESRVHESLSDQYIKKITQAAKIYSTLCPSLYESKKGGEDTPGELTQSELQVLQLLDQGKTNKDIAGELHVSNSTVKFHLSNIFEKLEATNRVEAIKSARNAGILA